MTVTAKFVSVERNLPDFRIICCVRCWAMIIELSITTLALQYFKEQLIGYRVISLALLRVNSGTKRKLQQ